MVIRASTAQGLFIALSVVAGCQLVAGIHGELSVDAGVGGGGGAAPEVCRHEAVSSPPAVTNAGGTVEFVAAIRSIQLEAPANGEAAGMNLDGLCTCDGEGPSCEAADTDAQPAGPCDNAAGRDVQSEAVFNGVAYLLSRPEASTLYTQLAEAGTWSVLLRVRGYNGAADDDRVELAWYESPGLAASPSWNGSDTWPVASSSLLPGTTSLDQPLYFDDAAYVTGGKLVASLPNAAMVMAGSGAFLRMRPAQLLLEARIENAGGDRYGLAGGVLGARLSMTEIFAMMSSFRDTGAAPFCTSSPLYAPTKMLLCNIADMSMGASTPDVPCDAVSFGAGFEAHPAALGAIAAPLAPSPGCPVDTDPASDFCMP